MGEVVINLENLYGEKAVLSGLEDYLKKARELAGSGNTVVITGAGPVWLYLKVAHSLHGIASKLIYRSPAAGDLVIFDHNPH